MGYKKFGPQKGIEKLDFNDIQKKAVMNGYVFVGEKIAREQEWNIVPYKNLERIFDEETLNIIEEDDVMVFIKNLSSPKKALSNKGLVGKFSRERVKRGKLIYRATDVAKEGIDTLEIQVIEDPRWKGDVSSWIVRTLIMENGKTKNEDTATIFPSHNAPKPIPESLAENYALNEMIKLSKRWVRENNQQEQRKEPENKNDWRKQTERQTTIGGKGKEQVKFKGPTGVSKEEKEPIKQNLSEFKKEGYTPNKEEKEEEKEQTTLGPKGVKKGQKKLGD